MPSAELPQFQNPDIIGAYLRGRADPGQQQLQQQQIQAGQMNMEQLRQAMQTTQMRQANAQQFMNEQGQPASAQPVADMPPGSPMPQPGEDDLTAMASSRRLASMARFNQVNAALEGKDTIKPVTDALAAHEAAMKDQALTAKFNLQPAVDQIESVRTAANPEQIVMANPSHKKVWDKYAPQLGLNPNDPKDMTSDNVRAAAALAHNDIAAQSMGSIDPVAMPSSLQTVRTKGGYSYDVDPISGKKSDIPGQTTPYQSAQLGMERERLKMAQTVTEGFNGQAGELLAALTEAGVSLPAGMRSKEQQLATVNGLLARHPDMTSDQIADAIRSGKINMTAATKEAAIAGGIIGKTSVGENELINFAPLALKASAAVPRGDFVPFSKLKQLGLSNISDPNLKELYGRTNAILNAYDVVAARGGTDKDKRAENRRNLETADGPAAYQRAIETMISEAKIAKQSGRQAVSEAASSTHSSPANGVAPYADSGKEARYQAWKKAHPNG